MVNGRHFLSIANVSWNVVRDRNLCQIENTLHSAIRIALGGERLVLTCILMDGAGGPKRQPQGSEDRFERPFGA